MNFKRFLTESNALVTWPAVLRPDQINGMDYQSAVAREEFLRDVIAITQGQESPGFFPDARVTQMAAQRIVGNAQGKDRRRILAQLQAEWQAVKNHINSQIGV